MVMLMLGRRRNAIVNREDSLYLMEIGDMHRSRPGYISSNIRHALIFAFLFTGVKSKRSHVRLLFRVVFDCNDIVSKPGANRFNSPLILCNMNMNWIIMIHHLTV